MKKHLLWTVALAFLFPTIHASASPQDNPDRREVKDELKDRRVPVIRDRSAFSDHDIMISRRATQAIQRHSELSPEARAALVSTDRGRVKVEGNVRSPNERERVVRIVEDVAGVGNVDNMLIVLPAE
jgi:hypothetical protein